MVILTVEVYGMVYACPYRSSLWYGVFIMQWRIVQSLTGALYGAGHNCVYALLVFFRSFYFACLLSAWVSSTSLGSTLLIRPAKLTTFVR